MPLTAGADGLAGEPEHRAAVTAIGAAHHWARRAKLAERKLRRYRAWQALAIVQALAWAVLAAVKG